MIDLTAYADFCIIYLLPKENYRSVNVALIKLRNNADLLCFMDITMKSFLEEYACLKIDHGHRSLGHKLAAIGSLYLECYPCPEYYGPFYYHTSQLPAKLLSLLADASDERAYSSLIAVLYALPMTGSLSVALLECISSQQVMSGHQPRSGPRMSTYYPLIAANIVTSYNGLSYNGLNWSVADTLFLIGKLPHHHRLPNCKDDSLANRLAAVGEKYLQEHPKPISMFGFFDRHYNQNHAHLLVQLTMVALPRD